MKCTDKERQTCNVEKMGCEGCYYNEDNDRDIEELKTLFCSDKLTQYGKRKFIEYYEQRIKAYKELEYKYNKALSDLVQAEHKNKELEEENEELISDNLDYQRTLDIFDKRTYRKKYLEERRKEEPNLLYPDADEIYKRYYKLREENKELKKDNKRYEKELHDVIEFSIPVSLVKEKIEELEIKMEYENNEKVLIWLHKQRSVLQELLEKRK